MRLKPISAVRGTDSSTLVAMPAQQDFRHFANLIARRLALSTQLDLIQAGDRSAIDANKMRMMCIRMFTVGNELKPPNVVPQFRATQQPDRTEVIQISKHRRLVKSTSLQSLINFGMRQGHGSGVQDLQSCHPCHGHPQS